MPNILNSFYNNASDQIYLTSASIGSFLGKIYGPPVGACIAKEVANSVIPVGGLCWNYAARTPMLYYAQNQGYMLGGAVGPVVGAVAAVAAVKATTYAVNKAIDLNEQRNIKNDYAKLNAELDAEERDCFIGEVGSFGRLPEDSEYCILEVEYKNEEKLNITDINDDYCLIDNPHPSVRNNHPKVM